MIKWNQQHSTESWLKGIARNNKMDYESLWFSLANFIQGKRRLLFDNRKKITDDTRRMFDEFILALSCALSFFSRDPEKSELAHCFLRNSMTVLALYGDSKTVSEMVQYWDELPQEQAELERIENFIKSLIVKERNIVNLPKTVRPYQQLSPAVAASFGHLSQKPHDPNVPNDKEIEEYPDQKR